MTAVQDSLLTQTAGSDSDFSGGAGGWEVAADMITAAGSEIPCLSEADLTLSSVCDPWFFLANHFTDKFISPIPKVLATLKLWKLLRRTRISSKKCVTLLQKRKIV